MYSVLDVRQNSLIALEEFYFEKENNYESLCNSIKSFISSSEILKTNYKKVTVGIYNNNSTLVPSALFDENKKNDFLKFNFSKENIFSANDFLQELDAYNIYESSETLLKTFNEIYSRVKFFHFSSALIERMMVENKFKNETNIYLHFFQKNKYGTPSHFEFIILKNGKLIFYNSFVFHQKEDIAYYLLFALEQLKINPANANITLLGNIQKTDEFVELIHNYVKSVSFGSRPENYNYATVFDELPSHFHYSLLSQYLYG